MSDSVDTSYSTAESSFRDLETSSEEIDNGDSGAEDEDVTIAESRSSSDAETESDHSDSDRDGDESIVKATRRTVGAHRKRLLRVLSESDSESEGEFERRVLSPRTRMSMTGIRPSDLSESEIDLSDSANADKSVVKPSISRQTKAAAPARKNPIMLSDSGEEEEQEIERRVLSPRTRMSMIGIQPSDLSDDISEIECSSADGSQPTRANESGNKMKKQPVSVSLAREEELENTIANELHPISSSHVNGSLGANAANKTKEEQPLQLNACIGDTKPTALTCQSPLDNVRYSAFALRGIQEKLSSTLCQETAQPRQQSDNTSDESSDLVLLSYKEKSIINIDSSDDEKEPLKQECISSVPQKTKVSRESYSKESQKLENLKHDLLSSERLLVNIGKNLPDGGKQLSGRIEQIAHEIKLQIAYLATIEVEDPKVNQQPSTKSPNELQQESGALKNIKVPDWNELAADVYKQQPIHTGKQGLATFNSQKALTIDRLKDLHGSLESCPNENVLAPDPQGLKVQLMRHQKHALAWLTWREKQKPRGGILADDMGLGKTLTMISLVLAKKNNSELEGEDKAEDSGSGSEEEEDERNAWHSKRRKHRYNGGTLVICPASLIRQWEDEIATKVYRNRLTVCVHHGNNRDTKPKHLRTYDFVITTYQLMAREQKTQGALFGLKWRRIILDEAHVIRNHKAAMSIAACELRAKYRWVLTGTPIQNKEKDMYALLKFLRCSPFDDLVHWKLWIDNKNDGGQKRLNALMKTLLLRRTKAQLQQCGELQSLPERRVELIEVKLDTDEMNVYQKVLAFSQTMFAEFLYQRSERNADFKYGGAHQHKVLSKEQQRFRQLFNVQEVKTTDILVLLLRLRQICCHPGLIDAMLEDGDAQRIDSDSDSSQTEINLLQQLEKLTINAPDASGDNLRPEEEVLAKASAKILQRSNPVFDTSRPSSKMLRILEVLKRLPTQDKVIVVSQWTGVLNLIQNHIQQAGLRTLSLNGTIPVKLRQDIITQFNDPTTNKRVLLLSLTAGGVGLNLVGANHLMLIDLHWNPQLEVQAQDRIYRVGQQKTVTVYKFMCKDTVEERIRTLQQHKLAIADGVLTGVRSVGSKLTIEDLKGLFNM